MDVQFGYNSSEEPTLLYKLQRKLKVFATGSPLPNRGYSLVACCSRYGIVFVGSPTGSLSVYNLKDLTNQECDALCMSVKLPEKPTHIAVNCDSELLAVTGGSALCIYKVTDFQRQDVSPVVTIKTDVPSSTFVSSLQWNPCVPDTIAIAFYDGTLLVSQIMNRQMKKVQSKARCICWSPKGKQLVTGNSDGTLCQYKPDLVPAKTVPVPNLFQGSPVEALAVYWICTFQFAVVYKNASDNSRPAVTIVNTPKAGQPTCLNYEDICFSMGNERPWYYYLIGLAQWNLIMASSSNSMEIATLSSVDGANWLQWCQPDEARPELPLTDKKVENYPVGICIDTCAIHQLPWGENETLPYMPILHVVSHSGWLSVFNIINLRKDVPQLCVPPQKFVLPAGAMTSEIPSDLPAPPAQMAPPIRVTMSSTPLEASKPTPTFRAPISLATAQTTTQNIPQYAVSTAPALAPQIVEKKLVEATPVLNIPQPQAPKSSTPQTQTKQPPPPKPTSQAQEVNAALKAEQERINKLKAEQELKSMLVKEVNDFQQELYKFASKTRAVQLKLQKDIESLNLLQCMDAEKLKKDCAIDDLHSAIADLKLELVRTCAFVAEARICAEAKEMHQWTQADPLTVKRVASVKKLAYYVQNQLEQVHKALDYKWNEITSNDPKFNKPGERMIRPILDDVYQPLVRQQEILNRQEAVLRTLKNTYKQCDAASEFKTTSIINSSQLKNKDPLSKLAKNVLNLSLDSQTTTTDAGLNAQKVDALRDMLSNHRPVKIKPLRIEVQEHLAGMKLNYEKSKETVVPQSPKQAEEKVVPFPTVAKPPAAQPVQMKMPPQPLADVPTPDLILKQSSMPPSPFTPAKPTTPGLSNVARTLFTDEPKLEPVKPASAQPPPQPKVSFTPTPQITASANTRSVLKDMLQNKMANADAKNDSNTFMGQKICSSDGFAGKFTASTPITQAQAQISFTLTSKPLTDINNMFSKFTPQSFPVPEAKSQVQNPPPIAKTTPKQDIKPQEKQEEKVTTSFRIKPVAPTSTNVPDVLKTNLPIAAKSVVKNEKAHKENVPDKTKEAHPVKNDKENKGQGQANEISVSATFKLPAKPASPIVTSASVTSVAAESKGAENKPSGLTITIAKPNASSLFAAANATSPTDGTPRLFGPSTPTSAATPSLSAPKPDVATSESAKPMFGATTSASFLFGTAAANATAQSKSGSIFSPPFGNAGSMFGTSSTETVPKTSATGFGTPTTTTQAGFGSPEQKPLIVFSTPTPASPSALFAAASAAVTTQSSFPSPTSVFATATTQAPAFGAPASPSTPAAVFGGTTPPAAGLFGAPTTTSQPATLFSTPPKPTQSVFGASTTAAPLFGTTPPLALPLPPTTTAATVFGSSPSNQNVFGAAVTTQASGFGAAVTTEAPISGFGAAVTTQASMFGASTPVFGSPASGQSVFGSAAPQTVFGTPQNQNTQAVFGTQAQPVFGSPPATTASGSLFGGKENSLFAAATLSTTSAPSPTSGGSIFGGGTTGSTGSVFASSTPTNVFGGKAAFGQNNPTTASIFGAGGANTFGQRPANANFWAAGNTGGGFGSTPFGGNPATSQAPSLFGGSGGSFSQPNKGQAFGNPTSVFGAAQQTAPAFGASPAFGAKPSFGQPAAFGNPTGAGGGGFGSFGGLNKSPGGGFGAPAAFGGGATFGAPAFGGTSPAKGFGGGGGSAGFGAPTQSNATFESLATQNTLTFGNLAQQSPPQAQQPAAFTPQAPSFTGWRG